jgi:hypothetical protein
VWCGWLSELTLPRAMAARARRLSVWKERTRCLGGNLCRPFGALWFGLAICPRADARGYNMSFLRNWSFGRGAADGTRIAAGVAVCGPGAAGVFRVVPWPV